VEADGSATYRLGQPLQFVTAADGTTYEVTLYPGTPGEIGFGSTLIAGGNGAGHGGGGFPEVGETNTYI
jgi:hypothetical protein